MKKYNFIAVFIIMIASVIYTSITNSYDLMIITWLAIIAHIQLNILDTITNNINPEKEVKNEQTENTY